jgi:uncharacterized protein
MIRTGQSLILASALLITSSIASADYDAGFNAFSAKDYKTAFTELSAAAKAGDVRAFGLLGPLLSEGKGTERSVEKGLEMVRRGIAAGDAGAHNIMGVFHLKGIGVQKDRRKARKWFRAASEMGHVPALINLGLIDEAVGPEQAYKWFLIASRADNEDPDKKQAIQKVTELEKILSKEVIEKAGQFADDWTAMIEWRRAGDQDTPELAAIRKALETVKDETTIHKLRLLAAKGNPRAQVLLGNLHMTGDGVLHNYSMAVTWYKKAAQTGDAEGRYKMSIMYRDRLGLPLYPEKVLEWLTLAAESGHPEARLNLRDLGIDPPEIKKPDPKAANSETEQKKE